MEATLETSSPPPDPPSLYLGTPSRVQHPRSRPLRPDATRRTPRYATDDTDPRRTIGGTPESEQGQPDDVTPGLAD
jgi:hypothetical protein